MYHAYLIVAALVVALTGARAHITETPSTCTSHLVNTSTTAPVTHTISVGSPEWRFTPRRTDGNIGDTLEFRFFEGRHWVIRGDFGRPCVPYEYLHADEEGSVGFSSGERVVEGGGGGNSVFQVRINDTEPIFFYSGAEGACVDRIMMGVVNPTEDVNLVYWYEKAQNVTVQLRPGESWPQETMTTTTAAAPSTAASSSMAASSKPTGQADGMEEGEGRVNIGVVHVVGIAVGAAAVGALVVGCGVAIYLCCRRRRRRRSSRRVNPEKPSHRHRRTSIFKSKPPAKNRPKHPQPTDTFSPLPPLPPLRSPLRPLHSPVRPPRSPPLPPGSAAEKQDTAKEAGKDSPLQNNATTHRMPGPAVLQVGHLEGSTLGSYYEAGMSPYSGWELDGSPFTSPQDQPQQSPVELPIDGRERIPVSRFKRSTVENGARFSWFDQPDEEDMQRMM